MSIKATENCIESLIVKVLMFLMLLCSFRLSGWILPVHKVFEETLLAKLRQQGQVRRTGLRDFGMY